MLGSSTHRRWHVLMLALLTLAMVLPGLAALPVIDRDEARYAQASVQMAESGDLLNIRFQDEARNKKPAAAYWAQTAMIKTFARDGDRKIWAQRLPSVFAALITILALYWGGLRMVGRQAAFIGAALLATSLIFVFEGHIAKTDALLCATTTGIFVAIGGLRNGGSAKLAWVFWVALGLSVMVKGPIGPLLALLSLATLWAWERSLSWAKPLVNWGAILVFLLIWLPWSLAIYIATDGAFFIESLGNDLGGKIVSEQENHGAPPGAQSLAIWLTLWPTGLFLIPGFVYAVKAIRAGGNSPITRTMRLCLAWAVPFWIVIEIMPTKLPHYGLPVFPALCLMMAPAILAMGQIGGFAKSRFLSGLLFLLASTAVLGGLLFVQSYYGQVDSMWISYAICAAAGLAAIIAGFSLWAGQAKTAFIATLLTGIIGMGGAYGYILPHLSAFDTSERLAFALARFAPDAQPADIHSPHYTEPSLVYHVGAEIDLKGRAPDLTTRPLVILDTLHADAAAQSLALTEAAESRNACLQTSEPLKGFNYSKGDAVTLVIVREGPCADPNASELP